MSRRPRLERDAAAELLAAAVPGAELRRVSSLRGGARRRVFALSYADAAGRAGRVVVRLSPNRGNPSREAESEFRTLLALSAAGLPVPRPLLLDADGAYFGEPCIVMAYAGRPEPLPRDHAAWSRGFAEALAAIHSISPEDFDLSHLPHSTLDERRNHLESSIGDEDRRRLENDPLGQRILEGLEREQRRQVPSALCLSHDDFWPGNVLWRRGRVSAVIDWSEAVIGEPARDVAQCSFELSLIGEPGDGARFLAHYAALTGVLPANLRYVELIIWLLALAHYEDWYLPGYRDLGLQFTPDELQHRIRRQIGSKLIADS
jgi:aminoglycoside phosphotransferase (APT) family kinase protein